MLAKIAPRMLHFNTGTEIACLLLYFPVNSTSLGEECCLPWYIPRYTDEEVNLLHHSRLPRAPDLTSMISIYNDRIGETRAHAIDTVSCLGTFRDPILVCLT